MSPASPPPSAPAPPATPSFWAGPAGQGILRNATFNYLGIGIRLIGAVLLTPFLVRQLGDVHFGLWVLTLSVAGYLGLFDFGIGAATVRDVADCRARGDQAEMNARLSTAFVLLAGLGALALIATWVLVERIDRMFAIAVDVRDEARVLVMLTGAMTALGLPLSVFGQALRGYARYDYHNAVGIAQYACMLVLTVALVYHGYGVVALGVLNLVLTVVGMGVHWRLVRWLNPDLAVSFRGVTTVRARAVLGFGFLVFVTMLAAQVGPRSNEAVIASAFALSALAPFAIGRRLAESVGTLVEPVGSVIFPEAVRLSAEHAPSSGVLRQLVTEATTLCLGVTLPFVLVIALFGREIISLWVGPRYVASAYPVAALLSLRVVATALLWPGREVLIAAGRQRWVAVASMVEGGAILLLSLVLVRVGGVAGVALATAIPGFLVGAPLLWYASRFVGGTVVGVYAPVVVRTSLAALPVLVVGLGAAALFPGDPSPLRTGALASGALLASLAVTVAVETRHGGVLEGISWIARLRAGGASSERWPTS